MLVISCRKEYKDRKAAANMPPKPQKPIWQPKRKHKKKKRIDDWQSPIMFTLFCCLKNEKTPKKQKKKQTKKKES